MISDIFCLKDGVLSRIDGRSFNIGFDKKGYQYTCFNGGMAFIHQIVFELHNGYKAEFIDHIDGDKKNNKPENLRPCTIKQNNRNVGIRKDNSSGFKGVTWNKSAKKWHSQIKVDKRKIYLGLFENPIDAAKAYDKAAEEMHGDFARTNKMMMRY